MQDVRSANPYIKRVQYLGEINRLKRITLFLRTVQSLCDVSAKDHSARRQQTAAKHTAEAEERAFIEDCRLRLQAVAAAKHYPEIHNDLLCRYLIGQADQAATRRVPLVGDCNRIKGLAKLYHDGDLKDVTTALYVSYKPTPATGQAATESEGVNLLVTLSQRHAIKILGPNPELRKKLKAGLNHMPKPANKQDDTRKQFLNYTVREKLQKTILPGWQLSYIGPDAADYAILDDGSLSPLGAIFPSALENHGGFYERTFLWGVLQELHDDQQRAIGKFLQPGHYDGDLAKAMDKADSEDIYRVLLYLKRLKQR